jgi:hypothetical protein
MTGTDLCVRLYKSVPVIFEPSYTSVPQHAFMACTGTTSSYLNSNFRRVLNVICFLLGSSPEFKLYRPTFRNTLSVPSS